MKAATKLFMQRLTWAVVWMLGAVVLFAAAATATLPIWLAVVLFIAASAWAWLRAPRMEVRVFVPSASTVRSDATYRERVVPGSEKTFTARGHDGIEVSFTGQMVVTSSDEEDLIASFNRRATVHGELKEWDQAIECLRQAQALRIKMNFSATAENWCRLPLYLQRGGRFEESMAAFEELLRMAPSIARAESGLDNPDRGGTHAQKQQYYRARLDDLVSVVSTKKALAQKRQEKLSAKK